MKSALVNATTLALPKDECVPCLFTDASDTHWASALMQVPRGHMNRPDEEQEHEPLSLMYGEFKGAQRVWSTLEKEGFPIVVSLERLDYLVLGRQLSLFTDHRNLIFIFDPLGSDAHIRTPPFYPRVYSVDERHGGSCLSRSAAVPAGATF
jgi:hypothetical protein